MSSLQRTTLEKNCHQRHRSQAMDSQGNQDWGARGSHTAPILFTPEEPWILIIVCVCVCVCVCVWERGSIRQFPFGHQGSLLCVYWRPWPTFFPVRFHDGTLWMSQMLLFQLSSNWDSVPFSHKFLIMPESPSPPFGEGYTEQGQCLYFHKYGTFSFSPINWAKCKS